MSWTAVANLLLAAMFIVAGVKILYVARTGRRAIRWFRIYGGVICLAWALFYGVTGFDEWVNVVDQHQWVWYHRLVQYFNVSLFVVWGFLFNEATWARTGGWYDR